MGKVMQLMRFVKGKSNLLEMLPDIDGSSITLNVVGREGVCMSAAAPAAVLETPDDLRNYVVFRSTITNNQFIVGRQALSSYKLDHVEMSSNHLHYIFQCSVK